MFITPGYRFQAVDLMLTNFHLPRSTLFMLVSAFSGLDTMQRAYAHAIAAGYRFYSYGDACLLFPSGRSFRDGPIGPGPESIRRSRSLAEDVYSHVYCGVWIPGSLALLAPRNDENRMTEPFSFTLHTTDGAARRGVVRHAARRGADAGLHAGRHAGAR